MRNIVEAIHPSNIALGHFLSAPDCAGSIPLAHAVLSQGLREVWEGWNSASLEQADEAACAGKVGASGRVVGVDDKYPMRARAQPDGKEEFGSGGGVPSACRRRGGLAAGLLAIQRLRAGIEQLTPLCQQGGRMASGFDSVCWRKAGVKGGCDLADDVTAVGGIVDRLAAWAVEIAAGGGGAHGVQRALGMHQVLIDQHAIYAV